MLKCNCVEVRLCLHSPVFYALVDSYKTDTIVGKWSKKVCHTFSQIRSPNYERINQDSQEGPYQRFHGVLSISHSPCQLCNVQYLRECLLKTPSASLSRYKSMPNIRLHKPTQTTSYKLHEKEKKISLLTITQQQFLKALPCKKPEDSHACLEPRRQVEVEQVHPRARRTCQNHPTAALLETVHKEKKEKGRRWENKQLYKKHFDVIKWRNRSGAVIG